MVTAGMTLIRLPSYHFFFSLLWQLLLLFCGVLFSNHQASKYDHILSCQSPTTFPFLAHSVTVHRICTY